MAMVLILGEQVMTNNRVEAEPWTWQTGLSVAEQVNDNVFLRPGGPPPLLPTDPDLRERLDSVTTLSATLRIQRKGDRLTVDARYRPEVNLYAKYDDLNSVSHRGVATLKIVGLGPGLLQQAQLDLSDAVTLSTKKLGALETTTTPPAPFTVDTGRTDTLRNTASAALLLPFTDAVSATLGYSHSINEYEDMTLIDSIEQTVSVSLSNRLSERTTVSGTYSAHRFDFEGVDTTSHSLTAGLASAHSPTLRTNVGVGASYQQDDDLLNATGSASITKKFQYTTASAAYSRGVGSSGGGLFDKPTTTQTVTVSIVRTMGERAEGMLAAEYGDVRSSSPSATIRSYSADAGVSYRATRWLTVRTAYRHSTQHGNATALVPGTDPEFRVDTFTITLTGTWGDIEP